MAETLETFLKRIDEIADVLEEAAILDLTASVRSQIGIAPLRLLIVGASGSGRFALANALLERPELLPETPLRKVPLGLRVAYSERPTLKVQHRDGLLSLGPLAELGHFLLSPATDVTKYHAVEVFTDAPWLRTGELQIENIELKRNLAEWQALLAQTDYVLLTLNATALLSENERKFCQDILQPFFGFERVAVVLTRMHHIPEEECASVLEHAKAFFKTSTSAPEIFLHADNTNATFAPLSAKGDAELFALVREDIVKKSQAFKQTSMQHTIEDCLEMLSEAVQRRLDVMSESQETLERLRAKDETDDDWLQRRIQRVQNEIKFAVQIVIQEEVFHAIDEFGEALREQLPAEVMLVEDAWTVRRTLPDYMEHLWGEFFANQLVDVRGKMQKAVERINAMAEADIRERLGDEAALVEEVFAAFDPTPDTVKTFFMPKRSKSQRSNIATSVQLAGVLFIASAPMLNVAGPIVGLGLLGVGQRIRSSGRKQVANAEKEALIEAALESLVDQKQQIKRHVTAYFQRQVAEAQEAYARFYEQAVVHVHTTIEEHLYLVKQARARRDEFVDIKEKNLQELIEDWAQLKGTA